MDISSLPHNPCKDIKAGKYDRAGRLTNTRKHFPVMDTRSSGVVSFYLARDHIGNIVNRPHGCRHDASSNRGTNELAFNILMSGRNPIRRACVQARGRFSRIATCTILPAPPAIVEARRHERRTGYGISELVRMGWSRGKGLGSLRGRFLHERKQNSVRDRLAPVCLF